jgi:hypothetical protein
MVKHFVAIAYHVCLEGTSIPRDPQERQEWLKKDTIEVVYAPPPDPYRQEDGDFLLKTARDQRKKLGESNE